MQGRRDFAGRSFDMWYVLLVDLCTLFSILAVNSLAEAKRYLSWRVEAMEDGPDLLTNFGGKPIEGMK